MSLMKSARWERKDEARRVENKRRNKTRKFLEQFLRGRAANVGNAYMLEKVLLQIAASILG